MANDGALAQLGERNTGSVEVSGSIPLGSTTPLIITSVSRAARFIGAVIATVSVVVQTHRTPYLDPPPQGERSNIPTN